MEAEDDGAGVLACQITGFTNPELNSVYSISSRVLVGGREIYWSQNRRHFMYFQAAKGMWHICPRFEPQSEQNTVWVDLLREAQTGGSRAMAHQVQNRFWQEFVNGDWQLAQLNIQYRTASQSSTAPPSNSRPFPPAPLEKSQTSEKPLQAPPPGLMLTNEPAATAAESSGQAIPVTSHIPVTSQDVPCNALQPLALPAADVNVDDRREMRFTVNFESSAAEEESLQDRSCAWVGYFPRAVATQEIADFFQGLAVRRVEHICAQSSEAVVTFATEADAAIALMQSGSFLHGQKVVVHLHTAPSIPEEEAEQRLEEAVQEAAEPQHNRAPQEPVLQKICKFYVMKGYCKFEGTCKLLHPPREVDCDPVAEALGPEQESESSAQSRQNKKQKREKSRSKANKDASKKKQKKKDKEGKKEKAKRSKSKHNNAASDDGKRGRKQARSRSGAKRAEQSPSNKRSRTPQAEKSPTKKLPAAVAAGKNGSGACGTAEAMPESFKKLVLSKSKVGIFLTPKCTWESGTLTGTLTGAYLSTGEYYEVTERLFIADGGHTFLRLADGQSSADGTNLSGWVCTRSRKDATKVVIVSADGSNLDTT